MPWSTARKDPAYNTAEYRRARLNCLKAARWRCQIRLPGCAGAASEADHTQGLDNDRQHQHLRAACKPCHAKVTSRQGNAAQRGGEDPAPQPRTAW